MLGKGLFEGISVIDDDVVHGEAGFCKMTSILPTEDQNLIMAPMEFYVGLVHQFFFGHLGPPLTARSCTSIPSVRH